MTAMRKRAVRRRRALALLGGFVLAASATLGMVTNVGAGAEDGATEVPESEVTTTTSTETEVTTTTSEETETTLSEETTLPDDTTTTTGAAPELAASEVGPLAPGGPPPKVNICHRTNSVTNPYNLQNVTESSVADTTSTHGQHIGAPFNFAAPDAPLYLTTYPTPRNGDQWGDIIPPFDENGDARPAGSLTLNWPAGQAIFNAGCATKTSLGALNVTKTVVGTPGSATFTVDVACNDGISAHSGTIGFSTTGALITTGTGVGSITTLPITGIPGGTSCTVTETGAGQGGASNVLITTSPTTITAGTVTTVAVTNTFLAAGTGGLNVTKSVVGTPGAATFTVGVACNDGIPAHSGTIGFSTTGALITTGTGVGSITTLPIIGIPAGATCTVTETGAGQGGATRVAIPASPATIVNGEVAQVTVTNTFTAPTPPTDVGGIVVERDPGAGTGGIEVAGTSATRSLATTGSDTGTLVHGAVALLGIGIAALLGTRRRRPAVPLG